MNFTFNRGTKIGLAIWSGLFAISCVAAVWVTIGGWQSADARTREYAMSDHGFTTVQSVTVQASAGTTKSRISCGNGFDLVDVTGTAGTTASTISVCVSPFEVKDL